MRYERKRSDAQAPLRFFTCLIMLRIVTGIHLPAHIQLFDGQKEHIGACQLLIL